MISPRWKVEPFRDKTQGSGLAVDRPLIGFRSSSINVIRTYRLVLGARTLLGAPGHTTRNKRTLLLIPRTGRSACSRTLRAEAERGKQRRHTDTPAFLHLGSKHLCSGFFNGPIVLSCHSCSSLSNNVDLLKTALQPTTCSPAPCTIWT